jgi:hypothetical protein
MDTIFTVGEYVQTIGKYSGLKSRSVYKVIAVSKTGNKVTIAKPEFATKKESFYLRNKGTSYATMMNDYTGYLVKA